jgi:acyl carrier protein
MEVFSMSILEELEKFMIAEVAVDLDKKSLDPDEDLLAQRILDSLGVMKLTVFLEKTFGIEVADEDIVPENFQSLNIMAKFVEHKMQNRNQ